MSSEPTTQTPATEQTWQEIRALVEELSQLAKSNLQPAEFYAGFTNRVITALAAVGGAVWTKNRQGVLVPAYQFKLDSGGLLPAGESRPAHDRMLAQVLRETQPVVIPPHSGLHDADDPANPTEYSLLLAPLVHEQEAFGVVELIQRANVRPAALRGQLNFLGQVCGLASEYCKSQQLRQFHDRQAFWEELEDFTRQVHGSLDLNQTVYTLANEGKRLIGCDRLTVTTGPRKQQVKAISGQDWFDKRANTVKLAGKLASKVSAAGEPLWYSGGEELPPQIEHTLADFVEQTHARSVAVVPVRAPRKPSASTEQRQPQQPVIGSLVAEWFADPLSDQAVEQRMECVSDHAALALSNALEHQSIFLLPLWMLLGKALGIFRLRNLPWTASVLALVAAVAVALVVIQDDFDMRGEGTLEPQVIRHVFAPLDGVVRAEGLQVEHGKIVEQGETLIELRSPENEEKLSEINGDIQTKQTKLASIKALNLAPDDPDFKKLAVEEEELKKVLENLNKQRELVLAEQQLLKVTSPIAGQVITWNAKDLLDSRPVRRGDRLLSVAQLDGLWELQIRMPEDRMGHVFAAQNQADGPLPVTFVLATDPEKTYHGEVTRIARTAEMDEQFGNTVLVTVRFDKSVLEQLGSGLRPGAGVTARIHCGRRSLGYVWFHDVYEFMQKQLFRL